jgi:hypothetical protein
MNVVILSMWRCGISWIGDTIKEIYRRMYGKELKINYENNRPLISHNLVEGWHNVYDIDPKVLLALGYDKVLVIKRELETMELEHAKYKGYLEQYDSYEDMKVIRPAFFERIRLQYDLIYNQDIEDKRMKIISLEDLNHYAHAYFNEIMEFFEFKMNLWQKIKFFLRVLRNKVKPFVIPVNVPNRNWSVYSGILPKGTELCNRLKYMNKIQKNEVKACQM